MSSGRTSKGSVPLRAGAEVTARAASPPSRAKRVTSSPSTLRSAARRPRAEVGFSLPTWRARRPMAEPEAKALSGIVDQETRLGHAGYPDRPRRSEPLRDMADNLEDGVLYRAGVILGSALLEPCSRGAPAGRLEETAVFPVSARFHVRRADVHAQQRQGAMVFHPLFGIRGPRLLDSFALVGLSGLGRLPAQAEPAAVPIRTLHRGFSGTSPGTGDSQRILSSRSAERRYSSPPPEATCNRPTRPLR